MESKNIRNIALLGHGNSGKTSLAESMLFVTGAIDRLGKVFWTARDILTSSAKSSVPFARWKRV